MKLLCVVGTRPNYMKAAPVIRALSGWPEVQAKLLHAGQHYDPAMSDLFFRDLALPKPDFNLGIGSGSHAEQTAGVLVGVERFLLQDRPDRVIVFGDVNSTLAAALAAAKLRIPVAHVEAGLRSGDRGMPEELNRLLTDHLSDLLFTHCEEADENLAREGVAAAGIHRVGNVMIDTLQASLALAERSDILERTTAPAGGYGLITLHRPENVDRPEVLGRLLEGLRRAAKRLPLFFPVHPRTQARLRTAGFPSEQDRITLLEPLGYLDFLKLMRHAALLLTDSGGVQEETTALRIPCLTLRENTERPITTRLGTNRIVGTDPDRIAAAADQALKTPPKGQIPPLWDGKAAERIAKILMKKQHVSLSAT
ncbi:MAG: UDP-N-acetylglucosamine 2-epimerase (non-hydrolyzing) [Candidatus Omnitrophica bacterium CG11_big_fil_rev_8_21_14_0_20_64_10]|nr:MAG: UDP-N-acetylglucosamine 2-epimerase (non-hydrolyzing) [Candidatus Omnitrophica bacterium CG11_big_fil_rev_8_21_14_0_20_64_10]